MRQPHGATLSGSCVHAFRPISDAHPPRILQEVRQEYSSSRVDVFLILQEEEPEMFERQAPPGGASS